MNRKIIFLLALFCCATFVVKAQNSFLQKLHLGINGGVTNYSGSLAQSDITAGAGVQLEYEITSKIHVRLNAFFTELSAADSAIANFGPDDRKKNYYFKTNLNEVSLLGQYEIFDLNAGKKITPYIFAGVAMYNYKPYQQVAYRNNQNVLRYANLAMQKTENFSNQQMTFPLGIGVKYAFNPNFRMFAEGNYRLSGNKLLDNYSSDNKTDSYYSVQLGILFRLSGIGAPRKGISGKDCNCPVY